MQSFLALQDMHADAATVAARIESISCPAILKWVCVAPTRRARLHATRGAPAGPSVLQCEPTGGSLSVGWRESIRVSPALDAYYPVGACGCLVSTNAVNESGAVPTHSVSMLLHVPPRGLIADHMNDLVGMG